MCLPSSNSALTDAKTHDDNAAQLAKDLEKEYRARDLLLVANRENPKALGDFGYVVDD